MKTIRHMPARFAVSLLAHAVFFGMPFHTPSDPWQDFTQTSLCVVAIAFLIPVLFRTRGTVVRILACLMILPPLCFLGVFLFAHVSDLIRFGHIVYADA